MKEQQYKQLNSYMSETKGRSNTIKALHDVLPVIMMVFYPLQILYLLVTEGAARACSEGTERPRRSGPRPTR